MRRQLRAKVTLALVLAIYVGTLFVPGDLHDVAPPPAPAVQPHRASRSAHRVPLLEVTCYLATGNRTASGAWPRIGHAAANAYPLGTHLRVAGRLVTVTDRSAPGATDVDLFMTDRAACIRFGRQHLPVRVVP